MRLDLLVNSEVKFFLLQLKFHEVGWVFLLVISWKNDLLVVRIVVETTVSKENLVNLSNELIFHVLWTLFEESFNSVENDGVPSLEVVLDITFWDVNGGDDKVAWHPFSVEEGNCVSSIEVFVDSSMSCRCVDISTGTLGEVELLEIDIVVGCIICTDVVWIGISEFSVA